jgi:hypothetical protein
VAYPGSAKVKILSDQAVKVVIQRARPAFVRAGYADIQSGSDEVVIVFNTPVPSTGWVFSGLVVVNHADNSDLSQYLTVKGVSAPSQSGFTVKLSAPALTGNYKLHWGITESLNP